MTWKKLTSVTAIPTPVWFSSGVLPSTVTTGIVRASSTQCLIGQHSAVSGSIYFSQNIFLCSAWLVLCHVIYLKIISSHVNLSLSLILWNNFAGIIPISVSPVNLQYLSDMLPRVTTSCCGKKSADFLKFLFHIYEYECANMHGVPMTIQ